MILSREEIGERLAGLWDTEVPSAYRYAAEREALQTAHQLGEWLGMANRFPGHCGDCPADGKSCHPNSKRLPCESVRNRIHAWLQGGDAT